MSEVTEQPAVVEPPPVPTAPTEPAPLAAPVSVRLWKCYNCVENGVRGVNFFAAKPICPTCKLDGTTPRFADRIQQCRIIHFDPPHPQAVGAGLNVLACDPTKKLGMGGVNAMATDVPSVVNCPHCRETEAFKAALAAMDEGPDTVKVQPGLASAVLAKG